MDGPLTIHNQMVSTTEGNVSQDLTLLNSDKGGSRVQLGNLLMVPLGDALLYVRPVYVSAAAADSVPELRRVVLAMGDRTVVGNTLQEAIGKLFPNAGVTTLEGGDQSGGGTPEQPSQPAAADHVDVGQLLPQHVADQPAHQLRAVDHHDPRRVAGDVAQVVARLAVALGHVSVGRVWRR